MRDLTYLKFIALYHADISHDFHSDYNYPDNGDSFKDRFESGELKLNYREFNLIDGVWVTYYKDKTSDELKILSILNATMETIGEHLPKNCSACKGEVTVETIYICVGSLVCMDHNHCGNVICDRCCHGGSYKHDLYPEDAMCPTCGLDMDKAEYPARFCDDCEAELDNLDDDDYSNAPLFCKGCAEGQDAERIRKKMSERGLDTAESNSNSAGGLRLKTYAEMTQQERWEVMLSTIEDYVDDSSDAPFIDFELAIDELERRGYPEQLQDLFDEEGHRFSVNASNGHIEYSRHWGEKVKEVLL